jgi:6-pyruvoyltetrahydropterin/6-carboxytetrahydropterin synthase
MGKFQSTKLFDGYSACFRQWKAENTHCKYLHGYAVSFRVWFEGELDERNWVFDFGGMKRAKYKIEGMAPKDYFGYLLDHTTIVAKDDPYLAYFEQMHKDKIIQLRVLDNVGCECFAEYLFNVINKFLKLETSDRVRATKVEVYEHERNSASYMETQNSIEMLSLFDYIGHAAGPALGKAVAKAAAQANVPILMKEVDTKNYKGKIMMYPRTFLDSHFKVTATATKLPF